MRLYILSTTGALVQGPGNLNPIPSNSLRLKLSTQEPLEVQYLDASGVPALLPGGKVPQVGVKKLGYYDDVFVALSSALTAPGSASGFYTATLNCHTVEFIAAIGDTAGSTSIETDAVPLMGEVVYPADDSGNLARSQTFPITGLNRLFTGSEGVPVNATPSYITADESHEALTKARAAEPGLGAPTGTGVIGWLQRTAAGVTSWVTTSAFFRGLANLADASAARSAFGLGTAATKDTGTAAGQIPLLVTGGKLPSVDGSQLTNLPGQVSTPRVAYLATNGNDSTAVIGNPAKPYLTAQAAYNAATAIATGGQTATVFLGAGNFGSISLTANWNPDVILAGISSAVSVINYISRNGLAGTDATYSDSGAGDGSTIPATTATAGGQGGIIRITGRGLTITALQARGGPGGLDGGDSDGNQTAGGPATGGDAGTIVASGEDFVVIELSANEGDMGYSVAGADNAGAGGFVTAKNMSIGTLDVTGTRSDGAVRLDLCQVDVLTAHVSGSLSVRRSYQTDGNIVVQGQFVVYDGGGNAFLV